MASILLNPFATGAALYLLAQAPQYAREPVLQHLQQALSAKHLHRLIVSLKWIFAVGVFRKVNGYLDDLAINGFRFGSSKKDFHWPDEVAVVTGASSGIGLRLAKNLIAKGIKVAVLDLHELPEELRNDCKAFHFKCDVANKKSVQEVAIQIQTTMGAPSILVNNAGVVTCGKAVLDDKEQKCRRVIEINLLSHYNTVQAFLPDMISKKKGHIVTVASIASFAALPGSLDYSISKSGVQTFHRGLTSELRYIHKVPQIKTTIVHPTFVDTPLIAMIKSDIQSLGQGIVTPESVADAISEQIFSCRSGRLIISDRPYLPDFLQYAPRWLSMLGLSLLERQIGSRYESDGGVNPLGLNRGKS
ncbi:hypothetical protein LTR95_012374 [Oleoguttula sp. CCFEE 5521]